jgi:Cu-Zn family superoxide dismutase
MRRLAPLAPILLLAAACSSNAASGSDPGGAGTQGPRGRAGTPSPTVYRPGPNAATSARAEMKDAQGRSVGTVALTQTPYGVLVTADLANLPPGTHAFHVHDVGTCEPPFTSAGGHFNPTLRAHGVLTPAGFHAGDMPNVTIAANGTGRAEQVNSAIALDAGARGVFDADGSTVLVHANADDYRSDPAGNAGPRIACGVIAR